MRESAKDEKIAYEEKIRKLRKGRMDLLKGNEHGNDLWVVNLNLFMSFKLTNSR